MSATLAARMRSVASRSAAIVAAAIVLGPPTLHAQTWRTVEVARQLRDSAAHEMAVNYGGGRFTLLAGAPSMLYEARIRYDEARGTPELTYDRESRRLGLALDLDEESSPGQRRFGEMRLTLSPAVPFDLDLDLGAVEAEIALGGLALRSVRIEAGASSSRVTFESPNPVPMDMLDLHAGAASLSATGLANANAAEVRVAAGVGDVNLDFSGRWTRDVDATVDIALGRARVQVPPDVGIRVELSRVLARFEHPGLVKQGNAWVSSNWETAPHHLTLRMNTTFGGVEIVRGRD